MLARSTSPRSAGEQRLRERRYLLGVRRALAPVGLLLALAALTFSAATVPRAGAANHCAARQVTDCSPDAAPVTSIQVDSNFNGSPFIGTSDAVNQAPAFTSASSTTFRVG